MFHGNIELSSQQCSNTIIIVRYPGETLAPSAVGATAAAASGLASEVVLHGKQLPWFVSDTLERDLHHLLDACSGSNSSSSVPEAVAAAAARWQQHLANGRWRFVADSFWTTPHPFWWMKEVSTVALTWANHG